MTTTLTPPPGPPQTAPRVPASLGEPPIRLNREMPMQWTATFVGAVAILAGSSALSATIDGSDWVLPLVEVVAVITLIGVGGRMIRIPAGVTALLQLAAMAIALTSLFTSGGIGGVLPNRAAVVEARQLLSGAWQQILSTVPPAPSTPELSFLIALAVGLAALMVDFLIAEAMAPALVALPLLCLYSVPASIAGEMLPWYTFAAPAILYALLLAVAGHAGRRTGFRAGVGMAANGTVIAALAIVFSLLVASLVTGVGTTGRLPKTTAASGQIGLSPLTSLKGNLQRSTPIPLLSVRGLDHPDYLRTVALTAWTTGKGWSLGDLRDDDTSVIGSLPGRDRNPDDAEVTISSLAYRDRFLPMFQHTDSLAGLSTAWSYDSALGVVHRTEPVNPGVYGLRVNTDKLTDRALQQDTVTPGGPLTDIGSLPAEVIGVAQRVTASAPTAFDKANALKQWFTDPVNGFTYSLSVPAGNSGDALVDFLRNKQGYCEQYASAMAVMLRALGIPSRVAIGFTQGRHQPDGTYLIDSHDAHAWVEVQFDSAGWVRFDPTPLVDGQGGQQGFGGDAATTPTPTTTAATAAPTSASGRKPDGGDTKGGTTAVTTRVAAPAVATPRSVWPKALLWSILVLVALAGALFTPTLIRAVRRKRRLAIAATGGPGAAAAAWSEIEDLATDHAVPVQMSESARVAANRLARRAHLGDHDRELLRRAVVTAEREWYASAAEQPVATSVGGDGGLAIALAPVKAPPAAGEDLVGAVRSVMAGLVRNEPVGWFDRWLPRSLRDSGR